MTTARDTILNRVKAALTTARFPEVRDVKVPPFALEHATATECVERFLSELSLLGVTVHQESTGAEVCTRVESLIHGQRVLSWQPASLPYDLLHVLMGQEVMTPGATKEEKATAAIGLTGVDAAIAETGSLCLLSSGAHARSASLLPAVHVAVVREDQIVATMGMFFERFAPRIRESSCLNIVTGPSRTADIELTLTLGVHGPGKLIVVLGPAE